MDPLIPIETLIPQRPPFVLVDAFVFEDADHGYGTFKVKEDHILVEEGCLSEAGLVENIAQTAAARMGYLGRKEGLAVAIGYIGAVQQLDVLELPRIGDELRTTISVQHQVFNVTQIHGTVRCGTRVMATCEMKIFISNKP
jgi:predicted hotdog family 3-hydroxylacyl-ACP dehydratase